MIIRTAISTPVRRCFDYLLPAGMANRLLQPGMRLRVPFRKKECIAIVLEVGVTSDVPVHKLKTITEIIDNEPLIPKDIMELCLWAADYYHHAIGDVLFTALPVLLRQGKPLPDKIDFPREGGNPTNALSLQKEQQEAIDAIQSKLNQFQVFLLEGITGSGKTEVYLQTIPQVLQKQQQVLVLVPEIGLTPQTIQRFRERFKEPVIALHSRLTNKERLHAWMAAKSGDAKIIIGTRSAIFSPFASLGLIIVDEEHDLSFKQQEGFRYHARDLAIMRARQLQIPIVLGSATPSLETLHNAEQGRYQKLLLTQRANQASLPDMHILDICKAPLEEGLSLTVLKTMQEHLSQGGQVMLFLNRRGYAPVLMCHACGWMSMCQRCDARMTFHHHLQQLHCHHCDTRKSIVKKCEKCNAQELIAIGLGTERLETILEKQFSQYGIVRIDKDSTQRKGEMEKLFKSIHEGEKQILIGTQMLAKGHHFPNVTLVVIVEADGGFFSSDFRALERMGQLILQVSGRAGRAQKKGAVVIQTHHPDHPLLHQLVHENYRRFAEALLQERQQAELPPYSFFALFRAEAHHVDKASDFLEQIKQLAGKLPGDIKLLGPIPALMPKRAGRSRMQLLIQSAKRPLLHQCLKTLLEKLDKIPSRNQVRWSLDIDPLEI